MSTNDSIEVSANTVEEAIRDALEQLGANEDDATIEVLATPRSGVLGLGARQARVRVTRRPQLAATSGVQAPPLKATPSAPALREERSREERPSRSTPERPRQQPQPERPPPTERTSAPEAAAEEPDDGDRQPADLAQQGQEASTILGQILELMGEKTELRQLDADNESIEIEIKGDGSGILIGRHGQTLDALEYLVNRIVARRIKDAVPISLETESYRARRRQQLHRMALSMGEKAKREHGSVRLEPMPPRDRRVVHLALKDDPMLTTRSAGEGFLRAIEIVPAEGGGNRRDRDRDRERERGHGPRGNRRRGGERGNQEQRSDEPREERQNPEALGEQGGFKHGQKRLF